MQVICVKEEWTIRPGVGYPVKDNVYTVIGEKDFTGVICPFDGRAMQGLFYRLAGFDDPPVWHWWKREHFRPCKETDISVFQAMLTTTRPQMENAQ